VNAFSKKSVSKTRGMILNLFVGYDMVDEHHIKSKIIKADSIEEASKQSSNEVKWRKVHEFAKKEVFFTVEGDDIETLIKHTYGHNFECGADLEASCDSTHKIHVEKGELEDEYDRENILEFIDTGEGSYMLRYIMCDMCDRGIIEEGTYLIDI